VETAFQILGEEFLFPTRVKLTLPQTILPVQCNLKMGEAVKKLDLDKYSGVLASYILPLLPAQRLISIIPVTSTKRQPLPCYQFSMDAREKKLASNGYLKSKYPSYTSKRTLKKLFTTPSSTFSWFNKRLNAEQKQAVFRVLKGEARPTPYIVFGPPGTGKTVTVVESVLQVFAFRSDARILVATPTNSSADLIAERLVPHVPAGALARLNAFQRAEEGIPDSIKAFCFSSEDVETVRAALRHRIIVATCSTSAGIFKLGLKNPPFTHAFLDEAGHMMEPEALIPIGLTSYLTGQIVMAGDPKQLGPVLQSAVAKSYGLHESLLERLSIRDMYMRNKRRFKGNCGGGYDPALVTLLKKNYRSNVNIIKVSSDLFYHSELEAMAQKDVTDKFLGVHFLPNPDFPVVFHALKGKQCQEADSPSWFNPVEGFQAVKYLQMLYELEGVRVNPDDVGIISPYRKQVEKIRSLIETLGLERVKVGSVEEFQGREKEVIIVSTVRVASNEDGVGGQLGFMNCEKRFNVAVTRAKSLLVVVGDPDVLTQERCWEEFVNFCVENRAYKGYEMAANIA
jgi:superfamily I DNA and/or RNA helicase